MRRHLAGVAVAMLALAVMARADEWKKNYPVSGTPELRVDAGDGNIQLASWDRSEIQARVFTQGWRIGPNDVRISESQTGNRVSIDIKVPHLHWNFGHRSIRVELMVPRETNLDLHTSDGNIVADDVRGQHRLTTGDGNIEGRRIGGMLRASTGDGQIRLLGRFDALDLHTGDGSIDAEAQPGSKMTAEWSLRSGDGNILLRLPEGFAADVDVQTGDGHISVDLPLTVSGPVGGTKLRGKLNGGGMLLEVRTGDGDIQLRKS